VGLGSSVGILTGYRLDRPGFQSQQAKRLFCKTSRLALGPTQTPIQWVSGLFPGGKAARAWSWPLTSIYRRGKEWAELYIYSPWMPSWSGQIQLYFKSMRQTE